MLAFSFFLGALMLSGTALASPTSGDTAGSLSEFLPGSLIDYLGEDGALLTQGIQKLQQQQIPLEVVFSKAREGQTKNVPPARLAVVLQQLVEHLLWMNEEFRRCSRLGNSPGKSLAWTEAEFSNALSLGLEILWSGVEQSDFSNTLRVLCTRHKSLNRLFDIARFHLLLVGRFGAESALCWEFALSVDHADPTGSGRRRLLSKLNDIYRHRGTLNDTLLQANKRLDQGASLRSIEHELSERYRP